MQNSFIILYDAGPIYCCSLKLSLGNILLNAKLINNYIIETIRQKCTMEFHNIYST